MEDNKNITEIGMEFVDGAETEDHEVLVPEVEEKPGLLKRAWLTVTSPFRWMGRKVKESPAAAAIGGVSGAVLGVGGKVLYDHFARKSGDGFIPADPIEMPDDVEEYSYSNSTSESAED